MLTSSAWANTASTKTTSTVTTQASQQLNELETVANQAFDAIRNVQYARLAIFNGDIESATKLTNDAAKLLAKDSINWDNFVRQTKDAKLAKNDKYVIIDASITLAENYVATPAKDSAITSANDKLKAGDKKGALEALKLAGVGVNETEYLLPLNQTRDAITRAQQLLKSGKYYEANLILRDAERSIVTNSNTLIEAN